MPRQDALNVTWVRPPECPAGAHDAKWSQGPNGVWMLRCDECLIIAIVDAELAALVLNDPSRDTLVP